jgi:hypothetical protein
MTRSEFVKGYAEKAAEVLRDDGLCSNDKKKITHVIHHVMMKLLLDVSQG